MINKVHRLLPSLLFAFALLSSGHAQTLRISEVMAVNEDVLQDEDGDTPDWIEIFNPGENPVSLDGWYLTDTSTNLTLWQFPPTNIPPREFLVVFASDKDRADAGSELHTNFKLSSAGEYVALVKADGTTIEDAFDYPELEEDISYGYAFIGTDDSAVLLDAGASCTAHVPTSSTDSMGWEFPGFNDAGWISGTSGIGYEASTSGSILYHSMIGLDLLSVMRGVNASVYIRVPFTVADIDQINGLKLKMKYDDAFIAYINGAKVTASELAPTIPAWNSAAGANRNDDLSLFFTEFDLTPYVSELVPGENLLAIHGINYNEWNNDLLFVPRIEVTVAGIIDITSTGTLDRPTPGAANASIHYAGEVETPVCHPDRGFYNVPFQAALSNHTGGAVIRYTLDGSDPTESSTLYTGPIPISQTSTLRCRAFVDGWKPSLPRTDTYIFVDDVVMQPQSTNYVGNQILIFGMDEGVRNKSYHDASGEPISVQSALTAIPTLSITTDDENLYDSAYGIYVNAAERWERPASFELINPDGSEGFHINAGLRIRGGWSRHPNYPKHGFRLFFRAQYGEGKLDYPLFEDEGVQSFDKIDLRTSQNYNWVNSSLEKKLKNSFVRDVFCRDSAGAMGVEYPRSRYYHLYLNGLYWGLFMTEERPVADFGAAYFGGDQDDYDAVKTVSWTEGRLRYVEATDGTLEAYTRLYDAAMAGFADTADYFSIQGLDPDGRPDTNNEKLLDLDNMIDYLLLIYYAGASDNGLTAFGNNTQVNNIFAVYNRANPDGFKWLQHDCEHALDTSTDLDRTGPFTNSNFTLPQFFNAQTLHEHLSTNAEYRIAFADRVHEHFKNDGALVKTNCEARLDFRAAQIDRAIVANAARWGSTELDRDTWEIAVAAARAFFSNRCDVVIGYLDDDGLIPSIDPPQLSRGDGLVDPGTTVGLTASGGTIYYTADGTDPRAIGGGISGSSYSNPIPITRPTQIKARCFNGEWSALAVGTFWTDDIPLAVTELMYHAPGGSLHDYIEIQNISSETVTLQGYTLDNAIDFKFKTAAETTLAPGEYVVAVDDIDAFSSTYPTGGVTIAGEFSGNFNNGGEKVDLEFRNSDLISFTYSDARNWPQAADGAGHSLVPIDSAMHGQEYGVLDYGGNWRASSYTNGSPGYADPAIMPTVVLNEITAHTDTGMLPPFDSNDKIELYNTSASAVTLNGWHLSDDLDNPHKWAIPNGTVVPSLGFTVFDEDDFHPGRTSGFGIDKGGEQVILSAPGRVVDAIRFKGQANGFSYGRYPDGRSDWVTTLPSPAEPNVPAAPTVRISELMYNPLQPGNDFEYIQLTNVGAGSVTLQNFTGTYRIDGGVEFDFPAGITLPAGERLWILSFNPTNTARLNLFCSTYGLTSANETFVGGYKGKLSDRGERVAIEYPQDSDDPLNPLDISWVVVDEVYYFDRTPWPIGADGTGYPLIRTGLRSWDIVPDADMDGDGIPDSWEFEYFKTITLPSADWDSDDRSNLEEYIAGTNPTNPASYFHTAISAGQDEGTNHYILNWQSVTGRVYNIYWAPSLAQEFQPLEAGILYPQGSYTDLVHSAESSRFYRVMVMRSDYDEDGDGLPNEWETQYEVTDALYDSDQDGFNNLSEFIAGTDPTNHASYFHAASSVSQINGTNYFTVEWISIPDRLYRTQWAPSLTDEFQTLETNIEYPRSTCTDLWHTVEKTGFYRVDVKQK